MLLEKLQQIDAFLVKAERIGIALVDKVHAQTRESTVDAVLPRMAWAPGEMGERRASYINGDEKPLFLTRMTAEVTSGFDVASISPRAEGQQLYKVPGGWAAMATGSSIMIGFDFEWNFSVGRRQSYYSRDHFASSQLLAGQERGQFLEFKTPIQLNTGESLEGVVRATSIKVPVVLGDRPTVYVKLRFYGFRG